MQTARFRWFIFVSLMIHTLLLYLYGFIPPFKPKLSLPVGVDLFLVPSAPRQIVSGAQARSRQPAGSTAWVPGAIRTKPLAPSAKTELSSSTREPSSRQIETSGVPRGTSPGGAVIAPAPVEHRKPQETLPPPRKAACLAGKVLRPEQKRTLAGLKETGFLGSKYPL